MVLVAEAGEVVGSPRIVRTIAGIGSTEGYAAGGAGVFWTVGVCACAESETEERREREQSRAGRTELKCDV